MASKPETKRMTKKERVELEHHAKKMAIKSFDHLVASISHKPLLSPEDFLTYDAQEGFEKELDGSQVEAGVAVEWYRETFPSSGGRLVVSRSSLLHWDSLPVPLFEEDLENKSKSVWDVVRTSFSTGRSKFGGKGITNFDELKDLKVDVSLLLHKETLPIDSLSIQQIIQDPYWALEGHGLCATLETPSKKNKKNEEDEKDVPSPYSRREVVLFPKDIEENDEDLKETLLRLASVATASEEELSPSVDDSVPPATQFPGLSIWRFTLIKNECTFVEFKRWNKTITGTTIQSPARDPRKASSSSGSSSLSKSSSSSSKSSSGSKASSGPSKGSKKSSTSVGSAKNKESESGSESDSTEENELGEKEENKKSSGSLASKDVKKPKAKSAGAEGAKTNQKKSEGCGIGTWITVAVVVMAMIVLCLNESSYDVKYEDFLENYSILGVTPATPIEEINRTFRQLSRSMHPDKNPGCIPCQETYMKMVEAHRQINDHAKGKLKFHEKGQRP